MKNIKSEKSDADFMTFVILDVRYSRNHERDRESCSFNDCLD